MLFYIIFVMFLTNSIAKSLYPLELRGERPIKDSKDNFMEEFHGVIKRDVFGVDSFTKPTRMQSMERTVVIVPSEGQTYPSDSYPSNPLPRYGVNGANKETTIVVMSSDNNNYSNKYRG